MKHSIIILVFTLSAFSVSGQQSFTNKRGGYQIVIPAGWTTKQEVEVISLYAPDEGEMDTWREKLEVSVTDANDLNLEEAFSFYIEKDLPVLYDGIKILKQGEEEINGFKSKWLLFSFTQSSNVFYNVFYLLLKDNKLYMLQGAAEKSFYPKHENKFLEIIRSFKIVK